MFLILGNRGLSTITQADLPIIAPLYQRQRSIGAHQTRATRHKQNFRKERGRAHTKQWSVPYIFLYGFVLFTGLDDADGFVGGDDSATGGIERNNRGLPPNTIG